MRTIRITHGSEILMVFAVDDNSGIVISELVEKHIDEICKKKYSSYDKALHSVSYWLLYIYTENLNEYKCVFDENMEFECVNDISLDLGFVISDRKNENSAPLYFMDNISNS